MKYDDYDPMSHRIIEKRRRDRMNNYLADLSRLIPTNYLKKGRGRIEKTEIIEMAIKYLKNIQSVDNGANINRENSTNVEGEGNSVSNDSVSTRESDLKYYCRGYQECASEVMQFLRDKEGLYAGDSLCLRLMNHLQKHLEVNSRVNPSFLRHNMSLNTMSGGASTTSSSGGYNANGSSNSGSENGTNNPETNLPKTIESGYNSMKVLESSSSNNDNKEVGNVGGNEYDDEDEEVATVGFASAAWSEFKDDKKLNDDNKIDDMTSQYKFKANMQHRFTHQDRLSIGTSSSMSPVHSTTSSEIYHRIQKPSENVQSECDLRIGRQYRHHHKSHKKLDDVDIQSFKSERLTSCTGNRRYPTNMLTSGSSTALSPKPPSSAPSSDGNNLIDQQNLRNLLLRNTHPSSSISNKNIPIFALHPKGGFYMPLSVDYSVIAPYLVIFSQAEAHLSHPITISVNFCGPTLRVKKESDKANNNDNNRGSCTTTTQDLKNQPIEDDQKPNYPVSTKKSTKDEKFLKI